MVTKLFAYDRTGSRLAQLPWSSLSRTIVHNDLGALTAAVPLSELPPGLLGEEVYLRVVEDGVEADDWYVLNEDGDDPTDAGGTARDVTIGAKGAATVLAWATIYPWDHVPGGSLLGLNPVHPFGNETPGSILDELLRRAQARGWAPHVTWTFTADHDSAGNPWPQVFSREYDAGQTLLKVVQQMAEDAWIDWEVRRFELRVYVPDTTLGADNPQVILRLGQGVKQAPRKRTRESVRSTVLAVGNEGAIIEVTDPETLARVGRRESYEGRQITDVGTLTAATQVSLARQTAASESFTLALDPYELPEDFPGLPRPGCYIRYDQRRLSATQYEPMRVRSVAWDYGDDLLVSVELADLWVDRDVRLERRMDAIMNGSSANERVPQPPLGDEKPPSEPDGLALNSEAYADPSNGQQYAQVTATWLEVTTDVDGTPVGELLGYTIEWQQPQVSQATYTFDVGVVTLAAWSPVVSGTPVRARIRAFDRWRNPSTWSDWVEVMAGVDETPPGRPSTPQVSNYLGLLRSYWDGELIGGRPADFAALEVHVSPVDGFDPDPRPIEDGGTLAGTLYAGGPLFTDTPYTERRFVRFVAVDTTGNRSDPSDQASGATGPVVAADIFDGAVGTAKLADLAVKSAKIDLLAVNSAQVGTIEVGKLIAGTMTAEVVMGGRIATALTGRRVEINSLGIFRWDANGNQTVAIDDNGALLTGTYRTALTGRRIEILSGGNTGTIRFISATGSVQSISSGTSWGSTEALRIQGGSNAIMMVTDDNRISTFADRSTWTYRNSWEVWSGDDSNSAGGLRRMQIDDNEIAFFNPGLRGGFYFTRGSAEISGMMKYLNGNNVGLAFRMVAPINSSGTNPMRMELVQQDVSAYAIFQASNVAISSDAALKQKIRTAPRGMLAKVRGTRVATYERLHALGKDKHQQEIGFIAQEAPPQMVSGGEGEAPLAISLYQTAAMTWGAVQESADRHDALVERVDELAAAVAALTKGRTT